jgi:aldose sugar dehydrogenase
LIAIIAVLQGALIQNTFAQPQISDPQLKVDIVAKGLTSPTTMAFLNTTDILVLEKDGNVRRVTNGMLQEEPVLQVKVQTESERGYKVSLQMVKTYFFISPNYQHQVIR